MVTIDILKEHGWNAPDGLIDQLSDYDQDFIKMEFTGLRTFNYYCERLEYLGFTNMQRVLDAGCGMGQWSIAMSVYNDLVEGLDLNEKRITIGQCLASAMDKQNVILNRGSIELMPYPDGYFDGIFCYGVFMFTNMPVTLSEFYRVLKPGGKLYVNANSYGWYLHLLLEVPWNRLPALKIIKNTLQRHQRNIIVSEKLLRLLLNKSGFNIVMIGCEGDTTFLKDLNISKKPKPAYMQHYWGIRSLLEATAKKA